MNLFNYTSPPKKKELHFKYHVEKHARFFSLDLLYWYTVWYPYYMQYNLILELSQKIANIIFFICLLK